MEKRYEIIDEKIVSIKDVAMRIFELDMETGKEWCYKRLGYGLGRIMEDTGGLQE